MAENRFFGLKKGRVNLKLKVSNNKKSTLLRVLLCTLLVIAMVVATGVTAFAKEAVDAEASESSTFASGYPKLKENATLGDRLAYGLQVAGIGMLMVFLVLVILMAVLYVFKAVATIKAKKPAPAVTPAPSAPAAKAGAEDEATVVAVATAAIAASRGQSECAFKVISVTKIQ